MLSFLSILAFSEEILSDNIQTDVGFYNMVKLYNSDSALFLSSIYSSYINGSHQHAIRGIKDGALAETYWVIEPLPNQTDILQGTPVQCHQPFRLKSALTGFYLHSHEIPAEMKSRDFLKEIQVIFGLYSVMIF